LGKGSQNTSTCGVPPQEKTTKNENIFFSILTTRLAESVEVSNSSLAQSPGKLEDCKALQKCGFRGT